LGVASSDKLLSLEQIAGDDLLQKRVGSESAQTSPFFCLMRLPPNCPKCPVKGPHEAPYLDFDFCLLAPGSWILSPLSYLRPSVVNIPSHVFVLKPCANVTARSRLVTGRVTGQVQKFSHFPQVVTVSRVKRGVGGSRPGSSRSDVRCDPENSKETINK
jgi:hypothetical protein